MRGDTSLTIAALQSRLLAGELRTQHRTLHATKATAYATIVQCRQWGARKFHLKKVGLLLLSFAKLVLDEFEI